MTQDLYYSVKLGRNNGYGAGRLSVGSVAIASGKCLLLPGDNIIPNNLTMPRNTEKAEAMEEHTYPAHRHCSLRRRHGLVSNHQREKR